MEWGIDLTDLLPGNDVSASPSRPNMLSHVHSLNPHPGAEETFSSVLTTLVVISNWALPRPPGYRIGRITVSLVSGGIQSRS